MERVCATCKTELVDRMHPGYEGKSVHELDDELKPGVNETGSAPRSRSTPEKRLLSGAVCDTGDFFEADFSGPALWISSDAPLCESSSRRSARFGLGEGNAMKPVISRALVLALISAGGRVPGFLVPVLIARVFGAGAVTDAYFIAYSAVLFLGGTLAQGVEQAIVPFAAAEITRSGSAAWRYLARSTRVVCLVSAILWGIGAPLLLLVEPRILQGHTARFMVCFTALAISWPGAGIYSGALVSQSAIESATASIAFRGVGALAGFAGVACGWGLWAVAIGLGAGESVRLWWLRRRVRRVLPAHSDAPVRPSSVAPLAAASSAQAVAGAAIGAAPLLERLLASTLGPGAASHLEYAARFLLIPGALFDGALAPLFLARWSREIAVRGYRPTKREVLPAVGMGVGVAIACGTVMAIAAPLVVRVLLTTGRFSKDDAMTVAVLLRLLIIGFVATAGSLLLERVYIAARRNQILACLSIGRATLRVAVAYALLSHAGLVSFAVGYAVADWCYLSALAILCEPTSMTAKGVLKPAR